MMRMPRATTTNGMMVRDRLLNAIGIIQSAVVVNLHAS